MGIIAKYNKKINFSNIMSNILFSFLLSANLDNSGNINDAIGIVTNIGICANSDIIE